MRKRTLKLRTRAEKMRIVREYRAAPCGRKKYVLREHGITRSTIYKWAHGERLGDIGRPRKKRP